MTDSRFTPEQSGLREWVSEDRSLVSCPADHVANSTGLNAARCVLGPCDQSPALGQEAFGGVALAFTGIGLFALLRPIIRSKIMGLSPEPYMAVPAPSAGLIRSFRKRGRRGSAGEKD